MSDMFLDSFSCLVLPIIAVVIYLDSLNNDFVFDDNSAVKNNADIKPFVPVSELFYHDFWGTNMSKEQSHKSYRPLCVLTFRLNYLLFGLHPASYHAINVLLHCINCVLFYRLISYYSQQTGISQMAAMLFSVHPVHTEAVTGVVGRADLLCTLFFMVSLFCYAKTNFQSKKGYISWMAFVFFLICSVLSKEQGVTLVAICLVHSFISLKTVTPTDLLTRNFWRPAKLKLFSSFIWRATLLSTLLVLIMVARIRIMGSQLPVFTRFDNPAAVALFPSRQLSYIFIVALNAWLLICPVWLCCDWTMGTVPLIESPYDHRNIYSAIFVLIFMLLVYRAFTNRGVMDRSILLMGISLTVFPFLPASNLFFPVGFVVAERILYIPSMGYCLLFAYGAYKTMLLFPRYKLVVVGFCYLLFFLYAIKVIRRNLDWKSEYSLFLSAIAINRNNAKLYNNVGHALESQEQFSEALKYFNHAAGLQPDDVGAYVNVGRMHKLLNNTVKAEAAYRQAISLMPQPKPGVSYSARVAPQQLNAYISLGNLLAQNPERLHEANKIYAQVISMRADYVDAYINRADVLIKLGLLTEATSLYNTALAIDPYNANIYYNLGVTSLKTNFSTNALRYFDKAIEINPDHKMALYNSASLLIDLAASQIGTESGLKIAENRLLHLVKLSPNDEQAHFLLGMLYIDLKKFSEAVIWLERAADIKPDFRSAVFNLALVLSSNLNQPSRAFVYVDKVLNYYPDYIKALLLKGEIAINYFKDYTMAKEVYMHVMSIEPDNLQSKHNLCVVYLELRDFLAAETCIRNLESQKMVDPVFVRQIQIVKNRLKKLRHT